MGHLMEKPADNVECSESCTEGTTAISQTISTNTQSKVSDPVIKALLAKIESLGEQVKSLTATTRPEFQRSRLMDNVDFSQRRCYVCNRFGHFARDSPYNRDSRSTPVYQTQQAAMHSGSGNVGAIGVS